MIDILSLIQQKASIQIHGRSTNSRDGKEYHSNCPFPDCGGTDRFSIWPETGRWSCKIRSSGCGRHGDAVQFLREYEGLSYYAACSELDIDPRYPEDAMTRLPLFMTRDEPPCQKWMDAAESFVYRAEKYLWAHGQKQLEYLRGRGLSEETIREARLGCCPGWFSDSLENWGLLEEQTDSDQKEIKIPEGIILPYFVDRKIWKLQVRRPDGNYFQALGSSDCLFNIDSLRPGEPLVLVEGEFDALSVLQTSYDLVASVATGGASKGLTPRWITKLKQASHILVAFDQDENGAGDAGAKEWIERLGSEKASRWTPWAHDVNDMLKSGLPIRNWVEIGLKSIATKLEAPIIVEEAIEAVPSPQPTTPPALSYIPHSVRNPHVKRTEVGLLFLCSLCLKEQATHWETNSDYEKSWCKKCWPGYEWREAIPLP